MQAELAQLIKKREKMNNSALDKVNDPLINSRKLTQQQHQMFQQSITRDKLVDGPQL